MKILHIAGGNINDGAAKGAYWLHRALCNQGVDSHFLIQRANSKENRLIKASQGSIGNLSQSILRHLDSLPWYLYPNRSPVLLSTGLFGNKIQKYSIFHEADIIHLHWINFGMLRISDLPEFNKPIIWTLRDFWPITGGCHYPMECEHFKQNCGKCPYLQSKKKKDLTHILLKKKREIYNKTNQLYPVCISSWMKTQVEKSNIFGNKRPRLIHNGVDTKSFQPFNKEDAKKLLGLPSEKKIVLVVSQYFKERWKGFDLFLDTANRLKNEYFFILAGNIEPIFLKDQGFNYKCLGYLHDLYSQVLAYTAADVYLHTSTQEAFGKTIIESMACGVPVVCFNSTGPKDIIVHKECGFLAEPFDPKSLADGIRWVLHDEKNRIALGEKARKRAVEEFDIHIIADKYKKLYSEILKEV